MSTRMTTSMVSTLATSALFVLACGGEKQSTPEATPSAASAPAAPASGGARTSESTGGALTPAAGGKVIVITTNSDDKGNYFSPREIEAHQGDVLRFTLKSGVHNVDFLPDSNPGKQGLPKASQFLQLPDQTYDVAVEFAPGTYYFQCDPHAALGMRGHVKVEAKE